MGKNMTEVEKCECVSSVTTITPISKTDREKNWCYGDSTGN